MNLDLASVINNIAVGKDNKKAFIQLAMDEFNSRCDDEAKEFLHFLGLIPGVVTVSEFRLSLGKYWSKLSKQRTARKALAEKENDDIRRKYGITPKYETVEEMMDRAMRLYKESCG